MDLSAGASRLACAVGFADAALRLDDASWVRATRRRGGTAGIGSGISNSVAAGIGKVGAAWADATLAGGGHDASRGNTDVSTGPADSRL